MRGVVATAGQGPQTGGEMSVRKKLISIVTPCYNEEENVRECAESVRRVFEKELPDYDFEHIFSDNASSDKTVEILRTLAATDPRVKVVVNSRNFGPGRSNFNALRYAKGDAAVAMLVADLQDPPEVIPQFVRKWEEGYDVVYGARKNRHLSENPLMALARNIYYRLVMWTSDFYIPPDVGEFQLIDRKVLEALKTYDDYYPYVRGMIASCGFRRIGIDYDWKRRKKGISKTKIFDLMDQALNGIISFSHFPLRLCVFLGFVLAVISVTYALAEFVINLLFFRRFAPPGIPTLAVAIFFFSGVQLFFLGVLGEYISAIHFQVRKRPLVIEREKINL